MKYLIFILKYKSKSKINILKHIKTIIHEDFNFFENISIKKFQ
jgi:hypothetical protein